VHLADMNWLDRAAETPPIAGAGQAALGPAAGAGPAQRDRPDSAELILEAAAPPASPRPGRRDL